MKRRAKIVATIGPASRDKHILRKLIQAGMNVARLNFSHGQYEDHIQVIQNLRYLCERFGPPVTILQDLQGPKIRTGNLENGSIELKAGNSLTLTTDPILGNEKQVCVDLPDLPLFVHPGSRILLADGQMELVVRECIGKKIETEVVLGGTLTPHKGVNLPGVPLNIPGFTEKDEADLAFGLEHGVDMVAISFVRTAQDIARVRQAMARINPDRVDTPIIAKLERPEALENLDAIIHTADGVMVARGDLGVEMSPQEVPIAQKRIIEAANRQGKVVITATQMLESMMDSPRPTRAEASDVANAIFDGTDAVMLSGETAAGRYPVETVQMMDAIVRKAEEHLMEWGHWSNKPIAEETDNEALYLCRAAAELAHDRSVAAVAVFTNTGKTALLMSKTRPGVPILAFTSKERTYLRMGLFWGAVPHLVPLADTMEALIAHVESALLAETPVQRGQQVVLICGFPVSEVRPSNLIMLHTVGQKS
ncbi:MAG TPA: pyruvate kinase [Anaerolineales bacterium]|nr:pyruvate kinase [Anaerolineales bacterium]